MSKPSSLSTSFGRPPRLCWIFLLIPGAISGAQQPTSSNAPHGPSTPTAEQKPLQIVRPMEGRETHRRGVPWIDDSIEDGGFWAASFPGLTLSPKQPLVKGPGGGNNTLRVSGWWTIDVKNPDGSSALHREVENTFNINPMIVYLLAGNVVAGEPAIRFGSGNGNNNTAGDPSNFTVSPCAGTNGCQMSEIPGGFWNSQGRCTQNPGSCSSNLSPSFTSVTIEIDTNCSIGGCVPFNSTVPALELNGQITSQASNSIGYLETDWYFCSATSAPGASGPTSLNPASCITGGTGTLGLENMTYLFLGSPISISAGQVISIKLDISFSPFPSDASS